MRSVGGIGVCGIVYFGRRSRGYPMKPACMGGGAGACAAAVATAPRGEAFVFVAVGAGAAPAAGSVNAGPDVWCATQLANCSGVTVNALKRMLACDVPQYSAQNPLNASPSGAVESGVNQM